MSEQDNKQQTQPNPELWSRFIEAVAKGQVKGLSIRNDHGTDFFHGPSSVIGTFFEGSKTFHFWPGTVDHICAELRRWMRGRNFNVADDGKCLSVNILTEDIDPVDGITRECREINIFCDTEELDRHLAAALWVLEREG